MAPMDIQLWPKHVGYEVKHLIPRNFRKRGKRMLSPVRALRPSRVLRTFENVKTVLEKIDSERKLHQFNIRNFEPNIRFILERGNFIVKTAENGEDRKS